MKKQLLKIRRWRSVRFSLVVRGGPPNPVFEDFDETVYQSLNAKDGVFQSGFAALEALQLEKARGITAGNLLLLPAFDVHTPSAKTPMTPIPKAAPLNSPMFTEIVNE